MYTLNALTFAVESGASIAVHKDGTWHKRFDPYGITSFFRRFFKLELGDNLAVASLIKHFIKSTELRSKTVQIQHVPLSDDDIQRAITAIKGRLKPTRNTERQTLKQLKEDLSERITLRDLTQDGLKLAHQFNAERVREMNERFGTLERQIQSIQKSIEQHELTAPATKKLNKFKKHFLAKQLRAVEQQTIIDTPYNDADVEWVKKELADWKKLQFPALPAEYTSEDIGKIESLCRYTRAIKLMRTDRNYRQFVFRFIFKASHHNFVDIAVQFPAVSKRVSSSYVDKRAKGLPKTVGLSFKEVAGKKDVYLRMQGVDEPISDMKRNITFYDKRTGKDRVLSVDQIFQDFKTKDATGTSPFEFTENGVDLCYPKNPLIDFTSKTWWDGLPVLERLTRSEVEQQYGVSMAGKKAVFVIRATREKDPLNIQGNHGWTQVIIPQKEGNYTVHALGKYVNVYPQGALETLLFIFNTHIGVISTVDENWFYTHREHTFIPKTLTSWQFDRLMEKLKTDLEDSAKGNMVFQAQGQNCSAWVQEVVDYVFGKDDEGGYKIPRLFEVPVVETSAPRPINYAIRAVRFTEKLSYNLAKILRLVVASILGGTNTIVTTKDGKEIKNSTITYEPWRKGKLALPALLFSQEKQQRIREAFAKV